MKARALLLAAVSGFGLWSAAAGADVSCATVRYQWEAPHGCQELERARTEASAACRVRADAMAAELGRPPSAVDVGQPKHTHKSAEQPGGAHRCIGYGEAKCCVRFD